MSELAREELQEVVALLEENGTMHLALAPEVFTELDEHAAQELLEAYLTLAKAALLEEERVAPATPVPCDDTAGALRLSLLTNAEANFFLGVAWGRDTPATLTLQEGYARAAQMVALALQQALG